MSLDPDDTLNARRQVSLQVDFEPGGRIWNIGYNGIALQADEMYNYLLFVKAST